MLRILLAIILWNKQLRCVRPVKSGAFHMDLFHLNRKRMSAVCVTLSAPIVMGDPQLEPERSKWSIVLIPTLH